MDRSLTSLFTSVKHQLPVLGTDSSTITAPSRLIIFFESLSSHSINRIGSHSARSIVGLCDWLTPQSTITHGLPYPYPAYREAVPDASVSLKHSINSIPFPFFSSLLARDSRSINTTQQIFISNHHLKSYLQLQKRPKRKSWLSTAPSPHHLNSSLELPHQLL